MNFSMTFKRWTVICSVLLLLFMPIAVRAESMQTTQSENAAVAVSANDTETNVDAKKVREAFSPDGSGNILLIHNNIPDDNEIINIEKIVMICTSLGKVVDYGSVNECQGIMDKYDNVIIYHIDEDAPELIRQIEAYNGRLMIIGSTFMKSVLYGVNRADLFIEEENQDKGTLTFSFDGNKYFEALAKADGLCQFEYGYYQNGKLEVAGKDFPFCAQVYKARFIPITEFTEKLEYAALINEIEYWLWPYNNDTPDFAQYIVLDQVYPFMPASVLLEKVDTLIDAQMPFVISVMPVTQNTDYPAMQQFCQVLSYAQANGAVIIMHAPIIHKKLSDTEADVAELCQKMTEMTMAYVDNGVYPMGIQVPYHWLNKQPYQDLLGRYRTVFVYDDGEKSAFDIKAHTSFYTRQGHQSVFPMVELEEKGASSLNSFSSALYYDMTDEDVRLIDIIEVTSKSGTPFKNLKDANHSVWLDNYVIQYVDGQLVLNGEDASFNYEVKEYDEEFQYHRELLERITVSLQNQNKVLMIIVVVVIFIFGSFILLARKRQRQRFLSELTRSDDVDIEIVLEPDKDVAEENLAAVDTIFDADLEDNVDVDAILEHEMESQIVEENMLDEELDEFVDKMWDSDEENNN